MKLVMELNISLRGVKVRVAKKVKELEKIVEFSFSRVSGMYISSSVQGTSHIYPFKMD